MEHTSRAVLEAWAPLLGPRGSCPTWSIRTLSPHSFWGSPTGTRTPDRLLQGAGYLASLWQSGETDPGLPGLSRFWGDAAQTHADHPRITVSPACEASALPLSYAPEGLILSQERRRAGLPAPRGQLLVGNSQPVATALRLDRRSWSVSTA